MIIKFDQDFERKLIVKSLKIYGDVWKRTSTPGFVELVFSCTWVRNIESINFFFTSARDSQYINWIVCKCKIAAGAFSIVLASLKKLRYFNGLKSRFCGICYIVNCRTRLSRTHLARSQSKRCWCARYFINIGLIVNEHKMLSALY